MPNEIYHRSNWGNANAEGFGDVYYDAAATNKLYNHSDYYENSDGTDKILRDLSNKASIVLTPTAYSDGSLNTVIPPYGFGSELVTNGTFDTDLSGWQITNSDATHTVTHTSDGARFQSDTTTPIMFFETIDIILQGGKKYSLTVEIVNRNSGELKIQGNNINLFYTDNGVFTDVIEPTGNARISFYRNTSNVDITIKSVSVKEIQEADFDFSRGSSATRVNEKGLIEDVQILSGNLVQNGNFATDSDWSKETGWTISNGVASHNGVAGAIYQINNSIISGKTYKLSLTVLNVTSGTLTPFVAGTNSNLSITQNGSYSAIVVAGSGSRSIDMYSNATFVGSIDSISVVEITDDTDLPRIDYTSGFGSLLLEPQSTNLITYSEDFSQWGTVSGAVVTDNFTTSPDGTQNAAKVVYNGTSLGRIEISTGASGTNTQSIYLKTASGTQTVSIGASSSDLTEVTVTEEWQRFTHTGSGSYPRVLCNDAATIYVWGAQLEAGSYATSYIPTSGSTVTRSADVANNSGNADLFNDSEGVLYAEIAALADDGTTRRFSISDGTNNNRVLIGYSSSSRFQFVVSDGGSVVVNKLVTVSDIALQNKVAFKYKLNDCSIWINGYEVDTDTVATMPSGLDTLNFDQANGTEDFYGKTKELAVFKEALTDAELESLTSWVSFTEMATDLEYTLE